MKPSFAVRLSEAETGLTGLVGLAVIFVGYSVALLFLARHASAPQPGTLLDDLFHLGAFNIAAWLMIFARARSILSPHPGAGRVIMAALLAALAVSLVLPSILGAGVAMALLGGGILLQPDLSRSGRESGWLLCSLAACAGSIYLNGFSLPVAAWDAQTAAWLSGFAGYHPNVLGPFAGVGSFRIIILTGCSSIAPLASVLLAYLVVLLYLRITPGRADIPWLLASLIISIALTEIRLSLMLPSYAAWDWWHNGPGVTWYELTALASASLFPLLASRRRQP